MAEKKGKNERQMLPTRIELVTSPFQLICLELITSGALSH